MPSILVEEVGIDFVDLQLPPNIEMPADRASESPPDVEMQQRMDEDESSSRSNSGDCDMVESMTTEVTVVDQTIDPAAQQPAILSPIASHPTIDDTIPQQQVYTPSEHIEASSPASVEAAVNAVSLPPATPSLSDYVPDTPPIDYAANTADKQPVVTITTAANAAAAEPAHFTANRLIELARLSWGTQEPNYLRGCLWSPDGTCILTPVNRDGMHIVELPSDLYTADRVSADRPLDLLTAAVHVPEMGTVYDYCWYPMMHSADPVTCCWLSTQQHGPIQMWDAFDGRLRCSYRGYDAVDEVEAAVSVCFSADGTTVIGGYRKSVKIFRTDAPGRDFVHFPLRTAASCLAVHAAQPDLLAVGAWTGAVTLHDTRTEGLLVAERLVRRRAGGVTQMRFTPDGRRLWVGARKDGVLACWDVRMAAEPVLVCRRTVQTNQRVQFDVSVGGRWLVSGDTGGVVRVWDLERTVTEAEDADGLREMQFGLHHDCCNGVALHRTRPVLATCSGQHHFGDAAAVDEEGERCERTKENSLIMWWYGASGDEEEEEQE